MYSIKTFRAQDYWYNYRKETINCLQKETFNTFRTNTVNKGDYRYYDVLALKTLKAPVYDPETEHLECSDKDMFHARRRAWRTHFAVCQTRPCKECDGWIRVRHERWTPNQKEYSECFIEVDKINVEKKKPTKVRFSKEPVKINLVRKYLPIDVYALSLATKCCTSLKEVLSMTQCLPWE